MRTLPLGPSVELPTGHETLYCAGETHVNGSIEAFVEHLTEPRSAVLGGEPHVNGSTGAFGGAPDGAHAAPYWVGETHVDFVTGAFGGVPYGATKLCFGLGGRV
eukprot:8738398-Pyramimonas_sp.AAC.1